MKLQLWQCVKKNTCQIRERKSRKRRGGDSVKHHYRGKKKASTAQLGVFSVESTSSFITFYILQVFLFANSLFISLLYFPTGAILCLSNFGFCTGGPSPKLQQLSLKYEDFFTYFII